MPGRKGGRKAINLSAYEAEILDLVNHGCSYDFITLWLQDHQVKCGKTKLKEFLQDRKIRPLKALKGDLQNDYVFVEKIQRLYHETQHSNEEMARLLQAEGYDHVTGRLVKTIRINNNWIRRDRVRDSDDTKFQAVKEAVQSSISGGIARMWGRTHLYTYLRLKQPRLRARSHEIQRALSEISTELGRVRQPGWEVARRPAAAFEGPDHVWSVDGHEKFTNFGIEIYAAIDAHSRRIIWYYVGIANRKQVSVAKQFIKAVSTYGICPQRIRADRGSETPLMADMQYQQYRQHLLDTSRHTLAEIDSEDGQRRFFRESFIYGTSVRNIRIESFWSRLERYQLRPWLVSPIFKVAPL